MRTVHCVDARITSRPSPSFSQTDIKIKPLDLFSKQTHLASSNHVNPDYLKIIKQECPKELRSSNSIRLVVPTENGTLQDNASKLFNNLPETIRNCKDYRTFLRLSRNFLNNRVQSH